METENTAQGGKNHNIDEKSVEKPSFPPVIGKGKEIDDKTLSAGHFTDIKSGKSTTGEAKKENEIKDVNIDSDFRP